MNIEADSLFSSKDFAGAAVLYSKTLDLDSTLTTSRFKRGQCYFESKKYKEAYDDFSEVAVLKPAEFAPVFNKALSAYFMNDPKGALMSFNESEKIDAYNPHLQLQKANCLFKLGRFREASIYYTKSIQTYKDSTSIYFARGCSYYHTDQYERALQDLEEYLKLHNTPIVALKYAAISSYNLQLYENCLNYFYQMIDAGTEPSGFGLQIMVEALIASGNKFLESKDIEKALENYTNAIALDPLNNQAYFQRGMIFLEMGKRFDACADFDSALNNGHPDAITPMKYSCPEYFE
ncbi:MAG: tetratricopeptide repeat protein [Crocinitomicaceae bacterium]